MNITKGYEEWTPPVIILWSSGRNILFTKINTLHTNCHTNMVNMFHQYLVSNLSNWNSNAWRKIVFPASSCWRILATPTSSFTDRISSFVAIINSMENFHIYITFLEPQCLKFLPPAGFLIINYMPNGRFLKTNSWWSITWNQSLLSSAFLFLFSPDGFLLPQSKFLMVGVL